MEIDFMLDGISAKSKGIVLQKPIEFSEAQLNVTTINVAGRDGDLHITDGVYKQRTANALCYALDDTDVSAKMQGIMAFLFGDMGVRKLSTDDVYYWRALVTSAGALTPRMRLLNVFNIAFSCEPFRYLKVGDTAVTLKSGGTIVNPTAFSSKPLIYMSLSTTTGTMTVNGRGYSFLAPGAATTAVLDCENMDFRGTNGSNLNSLLVNSSGFPEFQPGTNTVSWSGGVNVTSIVPQWRTL
jgi:phage-related protein